jgi:hypothetical protein
VYTFRRGRFCGQWVEVRGDCSFSWYWWNCWSSLLKLSYHNLIRKTKKYQQRCYDISEPWHIDHHIFSENKGNNKITESSDDQQFHQYQENEQSPLTSTHWPQNRPRRIKLEFKLMAWDRHKQVAVFNRLIWFQSNLKDPDLIQAFLKKWWVESDFKAPNLPLSLRLKASGCHYNSIYNNTWTKQVKQLSGGGLAL